MTLQGRAVDAQFAALKYWTSRKEWKPGQRPATALLYAIYCESRSIRHFVMPRYCDLPDYSKVMKALPAQASITQLITALREACAPYRDSLGTDAKYPPILNDLIAIVCLLKRAASPEKIRIPPERGSDPEPMPPYSLATGEFTLDYGPEDEVAEDEKPSGSNQDGDEDPEDDVPDDDLHVSIYTRHRWSPEQVAACLESGTHPADVLPVQSICLADDRFGRRGARGWARMENQLLPWACQYLPLEIAADGMEALRQAADTGDAADVELFALAQTILRSGATEAVARSMMVRSERPREVTNLTLVLPANGSDAVAEWLVPALPLPFRSLQQEHYDGYRECVPGFPLPDYSGVGAVVLRLLNLLEGGVWNGSPVRPFDRPTFEYRRLLRVSLSREKAGGGELLTSLFTFARLGTLQFLRAYELGGGNVVLATYLTQRKHATGEVPRFYETPSVRNLQAIDRKSVASLHGELEALGFRSELNLNPTPTDSKGYVGSPFCPTIAAAAAFLARLRREIDEANARLHVAGSEVDLIRRHNLYMTYTWSAYSIATCHRAVMGGYADVDQVEARTRILSLRDKGARGRLVPLADSAFTQMLACRDYLTRADFSPFLAIAPQEPIYFLLDNWSTRELSPSSLAPHLPFVANFARHLVRTYLAERILNGESSIPMEYVQEFLGHAAEGEERDGFCSAFDYERYAHEMRVLLADLLDELEFVPISVEGRQVPVYEAELERVFAD